MAPPPGSDPERRAWVLGILLGIPLTVGMLQVWQRWYLVAWGWVILFMFVGTFVSPFFSRKHPTVKLIMIALTIGTFLSLLLH